MTEPYAPRYPKHGTQAQRVLNALLVQCDRTGPLAPQIHHIASAAETSETGASARIRELRSKYGWGVLLHHRRVGKRTVYFYSIRRPDES